MLTNFFLYAIIISEGDMMEVKYHKKAIKFINNLPEKERLKIKTGIQNLVKSPENCDIKPMEGYTNLYRLRIGRYRLIYTKNNVILFIADIGNRRNIYKKY